MNNKNKKWLLLFLIVGIFVITIGYASFSSRLNLFGSAKVSKFSWTIVIDKWQRNNNITSIVSGSTNEAEEITAPSLTPVGEVTKVSGLEVLFNQPGDRIQYTFDIANKGTMDAELHSWELETPTCTSNGEDVTCKIHREVKCNGIDPTVGSEIKAGESIPCTYTVWYEDVDGTNGYEADPMEAEDLGVEFHYVEKSASSTYVRQIKVQFNTYGGETIEDIITTEGSEITLPQLSKTGYTFAGWTNIENGTKAKYTGTTLTLNKDVTLYPVFIKAGYTITYNLNNGEATNPDTYYTDSENITLNNPTKTGYTFTGWSGTDLTGDNNTSVTIPSGSTGNRSYEAHYSVVNYTITYNLDNGTTTNPGTYTVTTDDITLSDATKEGYTFLGWTGEGITTPTKNVKIEKGSTGNKTYTANYTPTSYTISYTLNGGSASNETSYTIESNNITLNNPSKNGYTFTGWSGTGLTGENNTSVTIPTGSTGNRSYEAHYTPINYTISYDGNTGTLASNPSTYNIETSTFTLNNPTKTVTVVGNANNSGATIGSNTSAAQTFYGWSGTGLTGTNNTTVSITKGSTGNRSYTANYQSVAVTLPKATKTGYTCYWYDSNNVIMGESEQSWMPSATSETTVNAYASCVANTYTVSFNANNGSGGQSSSVNATYDSNMPSISTTAPTRTGYTFGGWYDTSASTGGTQYYTSAGSSARTWNKTKDTTLYARWTPITYTISYSLDGGTAGSKAPTSGTYASTVEISNPTKDGYTFLGWTATNLNTSTAKYGSTSSPSTTWNGTTKVTDTYFKNLRSTTGTVTLTANWKANSIKFKVGDLVQMTPTTTSYKILSTDTGYSSDQTINPSELNTWRVIKVNQDGSAEAVSEYVSSTDVYFKGITGYAKYIGTLNDIASQYENSTYTNGSRYMGYINQTEVISDTSKFDNTYDVATLGAPWKCNTGGSCSPSPQNNESLGGGDTGYEADVNLVKTAYNDSLVANKVGTETAANYWLASRYYYYNMNSNFNYYGRNVNSNGDVVKAYVRYYNFSWYDSNNARALRPIITLKSRIGGTGTGEDGDPYVLE